MKRIKQILSLCCIIVLLTSIYGLVCFASSRAHKSTFEYVPVNKAIIDEAPVVVEDVKPVENVVEQAKVAGVEIDNCEDLVDSITAAADKHGIPLFIAYAIVNTESDFLITAYHRRTNCVGLCQTSEICLAEYNRLNETDYTLEDALTDEKLNLEIGFWYYKRLMNVYGAAYKIYNYDDAYMAYNVGPVSYKKNKHSYINNRLPDGSKYNARKRWLQKKYYWKNALI